jgi:hypothetical protein
MANAQKQRHTGNNDIFDIWGFGLGKARCWRNESIRILDCLRSSPSNSVVQLLGNLDFAYCDLRALSQHLSRGTQMKPARRWFFTDMNSIVSTEL